MKKRYYIKSSPNSGLFSQHTGILTVNVKNGLGCTVVRQETINGGQSITLYAYLHYINFNGKINPAVKISHTCGIENCVNGDHIIATYSPTKKDIDYINTYFSADGTDALAHMLNVPLPVFKAYLKSVKTP